MVVVKLKAIMIRLLLLLLTSYFTWSKTQESNTTLHILMLAPLYPSPFHHRPIFDKGHSLVPAVQLAVEHINNSSRVLPNHTLEVIIGDSGCNISAETPVPLVQNVVSGKKQVLGIVGPACTEASLLLANLTQTRANRPSRYGIVHAITATSDVLEDHQRYQHTFGMVSSFNALVSALVNISKEKQWKNIGVLTDQSRGFFGRTFNSFVRQANEAGISFTSWSVLAPDYLDSPLEELKRNHSSRIIFAIMSANTSRYVACLAAMKGLTFPKYQFVYAGRSLGNFRDNTNFEFKSNSNSYICDEKLVLRGLNGSILLEYGMNSVPPETYLNQTAEITVGEVKKQYHQRLKQYGNEIGQNLTSSSFAYPYYDATWALALSIHETVKEIGSFSSNNQRFLSNSNEAKLLRQAFERVSFQGVSVTVKFNKNDGHVQSNVDVSQVNWTEVNTKNLTFLEGKFKVTFIQLHPALVTVGMVLTFTVLLINILLHFVNIHFRNYVTIKASSPRLNHFIFLSCYLILLSIFFQTIHHGLFLSDLSSTALEIAEMVKCNLQAFLFPIALSLIISTVFAKLWRLYSIFNRSFKKQILISDKNLALLVLGMQACVILLNIPWLAAAPLNVQLVRNFDQDVHVEYIEAMCHTDILLLVALPYFFVIIFAMLSFWLAYLNRKIRLNEYRSKETIIFTYLFCLLLGILLTVLALSFLLEPTINVSYSLHLVTHLSVVILCNAVLFVPPFCSVPAVRKRTLSVKRASTLSWDTVLSS